MIFDPHSFATPEKVRVTHLQWTAKVDFAMKVILATAEWTVEAAKDSDTLVLDTHELEIAYIVLDSGEPTRYEFGEPDELLGRALKIAIRPDTRTIKIEYKTSPKAAALQWLLPEQAGGASPFLFTQSQAILARSWVPCQDSPCVRFTYAAEVTVPEGLLPLMSASNPQATNGEGTYCFDMDQPIPSYLLALAVGDISFEPVSERCGLYAAPDMIKRAAWEFQDLEKMVLAAESLYGPYPWHRYDVLVLPGSFPFGGMENPRITFVTPTIIAGDRSLTSLIAHELAHSWSGNLVTNATWNDFWLNEGFTVFFEHRIMEKLYGREYSEMLAVLAKQDLLRTIDDLKAEGKYSDTCLKLKLDGRSPDEGVTDIAYNKGYFFLRSIEEHYGREKFDLFVRDYFSSYSFQSIDTHTFIEFIRNYYQSNFNIEVKELEDWIFDVGLPDNCPTPVSKKLSDIDVLLKQWIRGQGIDKDRGAAWSTHEWLYFLGNLPATMNIDELRALDAFGNFTTSGNAEIITLWLCLALRNGYAPAYLQADRFLMNTGRRKFISPIYRALFETNDFRAGALAIYRKARPNYHFVATSTLDELLLFRA